MSLEAAIEAQTSRAADLRHRLHMIPELAYQEFKTAQTLRAELDALGLKHIDGVCQAPTATICLIGDDSLPCIALRADIDALPIQEQTGKPWSSTHPGAMHACGHDGHSSILVAAAAVLKSMQADLPVCVKFLWQPAEESGGGARKLVDAGALDGRLGPRVRAIFGLHGWPGLPIGTVASRPGPLLAATDGFKVAFSGKGCHGAYPHMGVDPIVAASEAVLNLQQFVSREMDPTEPAVLTIGMIRGGTAINVIPDSASIEGTARTLSDPARKRVRQAVERRCAGIAFAAGCTANFEWEDGYPATINDPAMTDYVAQTARKIVGEDRYIPVGRPSMGGEDFAFYLQQVPGCFFLIGVEPPGERNYPSLHSDRYDFSDAAIAVGIRMFVALARGFAAGN